MQFFSKSVKKIRQAILAITPEITAIIDDVSGIKDMRLEPVTAGMTDEEKAARAEKASERGGEMIKEIIDMLLVRQYDRILRILGALYDETPEKLENMELGEVVDMIIETLADKRLLSFFPRLRPLVRRMQSDI